MAFNPKNKRYNYTTGGEYTLQGENYIGYFNIENGIARTGRSVNSSSQMLSPTDKISVDMYQYKIKNELIFPDRLIVDNVTLPNDLEEIIIPPNEIVTNRIFIAHLKRLYENTLYLYSQLNIASNDLPNGYLYWIGISAANPLSANDQKWNPGELITTNYPYGDLGYPDLDTSKKCITVKTIDKESYISFAISDTVFSVVSSKADKSKTTAVLATSSIDLYSDIVYNKLEDIAISNNRYIFMSDSEDNVIYKYDISGYTTSDVTIANQKFLIDVIGIAGDEKNKSGFNSPTVLEASKDRLYVFDSGNSCIKVYTIDLSWVNTYLLNIDLDIKDIAYNEYHDVVFAIAMKKNTFNYSLLIFDRDIKILLNEYDFDERYEEIIDGAVNKISANRKGRIAYDLDPQEELRGIRFSTQDSNIFYVFSNYNIYKKFITKPQATIGKWSITKAGISWGYIWNLIDVNYNNLFVTWNTISGTGREGINIIDMSILSRDDNFDDIFVPVKAGDPESFKILYCNEYTLYDTVLASSDISIYNTTRFGTFEDEYVNAFTINKEIYKQIFNILSLRNLLKGKFTGSFNRSGNLLYEQYDYITDEELNQISIENVEDFYVHENEHVSSETLNRGLKKIYNIQQKMINLIKTRIKNITPTLALTGLNILRIE